ncbi:hypothetical protein Asp14428_68850 [Actinoplanes sp. NBRC 14428]|nr:hypothetical protein Asp14428_68850 [Actinoplanes sp. NBRC 14428]
MPFNMTLYKTIEARRAFRKATCRARNSTGEVTLKTAACKDTQRVSAVHEGREPVTQSTRWANAASEKRRVMNQDRGCAGEHIVGVAYSPTTRRVTYRFRQGPGKVVMVSGLSSSE